MERMQLNAEDRETGRNIRRVVYADDVVDLRYLFRSWWRGSWFIVLCAVAGLAVGLWEMKKFVPQYTAAMVVVPSSGGGASPSPGGSLRGFAGVASAFGIGVPQGGSTTSFDRLKVLLGSVTLAQRLQQRHQLMQTVYRGSWDTETESWTKPSGERFERMERLRTFFNLGTWRSPSISSLARYLGSSLVIEEIDGTGFRKVVVRHTDPDFARFLLETVYFEADELLREQDQQSTQIRKAYIENKVEKSTIVEIRTGLVGLLMQQENKAMLLESDLPYAARIIEGVSVADRPTAPNPRMHVVAGLIGGGFAGLCVVALVALFRRES